MKIIIDSYSMIPIYEQIIQQIKNAVMDGELEPGAVLPSYRVLAKQLDISLLTVKKAFDQLVDEGILIVMQGKGTYVAERNTESLHEEKLKKFETALHNDVSEGRRMGLETTEIKDVFDMIMEEMEENE